MIKLGQKVRDNVTGLEGIAYGRTTYLHGCDRITIQPCVDKEGKVPPAWECDEPQVEAVGPSAIPEQTPEQRKAGGPMTPARTRNSIHSRSFPTSSLPK